MLSKIKHWSYQIDKIVFNTVKKKLSINFRYEAIASEDRDLHWILVKRSYIQERNYKYHKNHKILKTIRAKTPWKRLRLSYSRFKLSIFELNVTAVCPTRSWIQIKVQKYTNWFISFWTTKDMHIHSIWYKDKSIICLNNRLICVTVSLQVLI